MDPQVVKMSISGTESIANRVCETPTEVVSSDIGKRIITIVLQSRVEPELRGTIDVKELIDRAFHPKKDITDDERFFLRALIHKSKEVLASDYGLHPNNVRNETSTESAKRIFRGSLIHRSQEVGLRERIDEIGTGNEFQAKEWDLYLKSLEAVIETKSPNRGDRIYHIKGSADSYRMRKGIAYIAERDGHNNIGISVKCYYGTDGSTLIIFTESEKDAGEEMILVPYKVDKAERFGDYVLYRYRDKKGIQKLGSDKPLFDDCDSISNPDDGKFLVQKGTTFWLMDGEGETVEQHNRIGFSEKQLKKAVNEELGIGEGDFECTKHNGFMLLLKSGDEFYIEITQLSEEKNGPLKRLGGLGKTSTKRTQVSIALSEII